MEALLEESMDRREARAGKVLGGLAAAWGLLGIFFMLGRAIWRLGAVALEAFSSSPLTVWHWLGTALWVAGMAWFEGYKGFQRGFAPRVVVRAVHLSRNPRPLHAVLAPLFCMGLIHATRRRLLTSWLVVFGVVAMVMAVGQLPQPWRGLVDAGVVVGLAWGLLAVMVHAGRALTGRPPRVGADLPAPR